jgi:ATP-binding cassette subfamily C protein LapB
LQHDNIDNLALQEAVQGALSTHPNDSKKQLKIIAEHLHLPRPHWLEEADMSAMPLLMLASDGQWHILRGKNYKNQWVSERLDAETHNWIEDAHNEITDFTFVTIKLNKPYVVSTSQVFSLIRKEVFSDQKFLVEVLLGGLLVNIVALVISFYSMQIYDRVIPSNALQTLFVLTLGVIVATLFDFFVKQTRAHLYEKRVDHVDHRLARAIYMRFLAIRLDQLPQSVGALASQMRGYETVRSFLTSVTSSLFVDAPFALFFLLVIALIGGWLVIIPLVFSIVSIIIGCYYKKSVDIIAAKSSHASNVKTGLLVETIEGAETIKSGQGGWRMLSRWLNVTDDARKHDLNIRNINERLQHLTAAFQQISYILMIAVGAWLVGCGELTTGGLIAVSILSGRILASISAVQNQLILWSHTKAALNSLDILWDLQDDHNGYENPIVIENIRGHFQFDSVIAYYNGVKALTVTNLTIFPGEKIGVIGQVGAGKTTLLRLLSGMYKPKEGRILLDDIDLTHISKPTLAENIAYVAQDSRLFSGTLRDNLVIGLMDPGDDAILQAAKKTGLLPAVILRHPKGLLQEIFEGGTGLSGGQRQLVKITRAFLRTPRIWLLDEPTGSLDKGLESTIIHALKNALKPEDTVILVTHKPEMLEIVDRLIVIANHNIVLDGPKQLVLQKLQNNNLRGQVDHA